MRICQAEVLVNLMNRQENGVLGPTVKSQFSSATTIKLRAKWGWMMLPLQSYGTMGGSDLPSMK